MAHYYVLNIKNLPSSLEEQLTSLLFEYGAQGVAEDLPFEQTLQQFDPVPVPKGMKDLKSYFSEAPVPELFQRLEAEPFGLSHGDKAGASWSLVQEMEKDWLEEWKKGFKAFPLAEDFWMVPRWETVPEAAKIAFHIEPGMAFGTGTHETTQLIVEAMAPLPPQGSFLDVGTGTGLLAYYALKRGHRPVLALDNDPEALRVAEENLQHNGAEKVEVSGTPVEALNQSFDVVAANIIQNVLLALREGLVRATRPGGVLLLSGILKDHEAEFVREFFPGTPLKLQGRWEKGDWVCLSAVREAP